MHLDKVLENRKSVRKFKEKKTDWRKIIKAIDGARYAPTAGGNFVSKFILVDNKEKILEISNACQQPFISEAHYVIVACSKPQRIIGLYGERGERYVKHQTGAAIENILLKLSQEGLSTCWIGYFVDEQIKNILNIPEDVDVDVILPIGYELKKMPPKNKIMLDNILYFDKYGRKEKKKPKNMKA